MIPEKILRLMTVTNRYFMEKWPDPGKEIVTNRPRPSNIWTRAVYYEGLMELYKIDPRSEYYNYAVRWGEFHKWNFRDGKTYTRDADNQCAGQTYLELYNIDPEPLRIQNIKRCIDSMLKTSNIDDWFWIDALQMAMPVFSRLGAVFNDEKYFSRMYEMYIYTRDTLGLYNHEDHLWWRDINFKPPYKEPNGENCYWSRGNGWAAAALVRTLTYLPENHEHRPEYINNLTEMLNAVKKVQREDGFWNVSLHDPDNFCGKETTGTSLFIYGMAWALNNQYIEREKYLNAVLKAWNALINEAVHPDGFIGHVQGTGSGPADGQPVGYRSKPDFEDFGLGCFLLAASEIYKMK